MLVNNKDNIRILLNRVKCKACGDIITSRYRHDFVSCGCKKICTDGGLAYIRRVGDVDLMEDMSVYSDAPFSVVRSVFVRGSYGVKGNEALQWIVLKDMTEDHLLAVIEYCEVYEYKDYYDLYLKEKEYRELKNIMLLYEKVLDI